MSRRVLSSAPPTPLVLLVLVAALVGLVGWNGRPAAGQCTMPLYNDGFVSFDTTRYLNIASPSFQLKSTPWSISMWVRSNPAGRQRFWFGYGTTPGSDDYITLGQNSDDSARLGFASDNFDAGAYASNAADTAWHFWVFAYSGNSGGRMQRIWLDGVQYTSGGRQSSGSLNTPQGPLRIGCRNEANTWMQGDVDEVMVWNSVLSTAVINLNLVGDYSQNDPLDSTKGCLLWQKFNEGSGTTAADDLGNTANNAVWVSSQGWRANTAANTPNCLPGWFRRWSIVLSQASVRIGVYTTVFVYQVDNYENQMTSYTAIGIASTSCTISVVGGTAVQAMTSGGTVVPVNQIPVTIVGGVGSFQIMDTVIEQITFSGIDSATTGRTNFGTSPQLSFVAPLLWNVDIRLSGVSQAYSPSPMHTGLATTYTVQTLPWAASQVTLVPRFTGGTHTMSINGGPTGAVAFPSDNTNSSPIGLTIIGTNTIVISSTESNPTATYTYTFLIQRLPPDFSAVNFATFPAVVAVTPPFTPGVFTTSNVNVPGALQSMILTLTFATPGTITLVVNGADQGYITSGTPINVTRSTDPLITTVTIASSWDGGAYTFSSILACPVPYMCYPSATPGCEMTCQFCQGTIYRQACMKQRPACCGQVGCVC